MKKRKTYEISVIDKTYSKIISDETKFYTSDTALELGFELKETEYNFESAEIVLLNVDDRSLVTRSVAKNLDGFTYELDDDIIAHYGDWRGQLRFEQDGEIYVSSPVKFRIENDLSNDRPPQLTEVNNWKNLRSIADGLIDDLRVELESLAEQELEIENAETARQQAESKRQSTFETNETERQATFENAEQSRQSAEQQRTESETLRVENDTKRETEIANIKDDILKFNTVTLNGEIENGDFSDGASGWSSELGTLTVSNGIATVTSRGTNRIQRLLRNNVTLNKNEKYYFNTNFSYVSNDYTSLMFQFYKSLSSTNPSTTISNIKSGNASWLFENTSETGQYRLTIAFTSISLDASNRFETSYVSLLNLTKIFGAGNEPSKEVMDWIIKQNGYFDELTLRRDDIQQYEINQLRKAVLALGGVL